MHELGIMFHIVETVLEIAEENELAEVEAIVLEVGALSQVVPKYLFDCFPAACDGTMLEQTKLEIEELPANGKCKGCGSVYNVVETRRLCPACGETRYELLSGTEFSIKEIRAR